MTVTTTLPLGNLPVECKRYDPDWLKAAVYGNNDRLCQDCWVLYVKDKPCCEEHHAEHLLHQLANE